MSIASILNAQITDENGVSAVGTFNQTLTGKIGIGTSNPTTELDVNGVLTANVGFFNNSLPDGVTFVDVTDRNTKTKQLGLGQGPNNSSLLNFFDFPESNFDSQARVYLGLHDRSGNLRWRFQASEEGSSYFHHFDRNQSTTFQFSEHTNDNVFLRLPKANSYVSIGTTSFNDNGDLYKLTVNGKMRAHAVKVYTDWADFVFEKDYKLPTLKEVDNMVTSPPYYNAREYTQWSNLYNYVHDMYHVALGSSQALKKGGVFLFNIGDIFDNENTTVTSKMGQKRIPLGAYIIFAFKQAGFELLDNVIWYKGEPQSNRHKNDGNNVPYYQRPANSYEHMFVFKKLGAKLKLNSSKKQQITNNLQKFIPVYKIVKSKGEKINNYGHTAPFPEDIPRISMLNFTKKGDVVLDPFLGSGTTIFTSAKHDRIGAGIELNENYIKLSKKKIKEKSSIELD